MSWTIPGESELKAFRSEADTIIDAIDTVVTAVTNHPVVFAALGLSAELPALEKLDAVLKSFKNAIDSV